MGSVGVCVCIVGFEMGEGSSGRDGGEVEGRFHHFLGGLTLPVTAMSWLMFELYVERSAEKVIAELERPLSTLIRPGQDVIDSMAASMTTMSVEDVSRRTLNVCEGEGDNYAFGYELNGDHPLVPSGLGTMTGARFVSCLLEEENTVVIINSCLYEKGYMAVGTYERRDDGVEVTVNSVFHRDRPGDILFQLSSTDYPVGPHTNSISLLEERRKGLSSWDRTRKFYNHSTHGWRQFSIVCRRKEANGAVITSLLQKNVTLYSSRTMDTRDLHDLQIQYVHTLIDDHQDRPMMIPALNSVATNIKRNRDGRFGFIMPPEVSLHGLARTRKRKKNLFGGLVFSQKGRASGLECQSST